MNDTRILKPDDKVKIYAGGQWTGEIMTIDRVKLGGYIGFLENGNERFCSFNEVVLLERSNEA